LHMTHYTPNETPEETPAPDWSLPVLTYNGQAINQTGTPPAVAIETLSDTQVFSLYSRAYGILHAYNETDLPTPQQYLAADRAQEVRAVCYDVLIARFNDKLQAAADSHMRKTKE